MATVTSLTADRMLAIEAASVVDGDVIGDNLILTTKGGTQINAGSVRGPAGPQGPVGQDTQVLTAIPVLDVGLLGQIRAGHQLTAADFTSMGLAAPLGLWNLSDLSDASGNGRPLLNKGAVGFGVGINGLPNTSAKFAGSVTQALYIPDTGAADPFRIKTGTWGAWFKTGKRGTGQIIIGKWNNTGNQTSWILYISDTNRLQFDYSFNGAGAGGPGGLTDIADDRWHFAVATFDGSLLRLYCDGVAENAGFATTGTLFGSSAPLNIGIGSGADASNNGLTPHFGRIDEVFVSAEVLTEDQIRNLYCTKIPHTIGAIPTRTSLNIRRRRRNSLLTLADFSIAPLRLHNFSAGSMGDEGTHNLPLNNSGGVSTAGVDGTPNNAYYFSGANAVLLNNDTGLPAGLAARSYGCWFKTTMTASGGLVGWGANQGDTRLVVEPGGSLTAWNTAGAASGGIVNDGDWHHVVVVEDNVATDGAKVKLYLDGRLRDAQSGLGATVLGGVNRFCVGRKPDSSAPFVGQIDSVFVCGYAMSAEEIYKIHSKGAQTLAPSPKNAGDHVEALTSTDILATFDSLEPTSQVDLGVAA